MFTRFKQMAPGRRTTRWGGKIGMALSLVGAGLGLGLGFGLGAGIALGTRTGSTLADRLHLARLGPRPAPRQKNGRARLGRLQKRLPIAR